jgi:glycosyltransferase involved in cell wall biosynthesis
MQAKSWSSIPAAETIEIVEHESASPPGLTIVIPALNEEEAIAAIIERCLAAREVIISRTGVATVDIVVVSDGSTDRTAEIAASYPEVHRIVFPTNRGYGAAIQAGWQACPHELLGFLDADGTCDPLFFVPLCNAILQGGHDIAIGSRMGPDSQMPRVRRIGNRLYAGLLWMLSHRQVEDAASGMRVLRRSILPRLMPLPDGLHFTPAMSARALIDDLSIAALPMSYKERIGRSKLHIWKDGLRFLRVILETALYVRPSRLTLPVIGLLLLFSAAMLAHPTWVYVQHRYVEDWMIYRFLLSGMFTTIAVLLLGATYIIEQLIAVSRADFQQRLERRSHWWTRVDERLILLFGLALGVLGVYLAWPAVVSYVRTQHVSVHWSRVVTAMFCEILAAQAGSTLLLNQIVRGVVRQQAGWLPVLRGEERRPVERVRV